MTLCHPVVWGWNSDCIWSPWLARRVERVDVLVVAKENHQIYATIFDCQKLGSRCIILALITTCIFLNLAVSRVIFAATILTIYEGILLLTGVAAVITTVPQQHPRLNYLELLSVHCAFEDLEEVSHQLWGQLGFKPAKVPFPPFGW